MGSLKVTLSNTMVISKWVAQELPVEVSKATRSNHRVSRATITLCSSKPGCHNRPNPRSTNPDSESRNHPNRLSALFDVFRVFNYYY